MYFFHVGHGHVPVAERKRIRNILGKLEIDADFITVRDPNPRYWFRLNQNLGMPHDAQRTRQVLDAVGQVRVG